MSIILLLLLFFACTLAQKKIEAAEKYGVYADFILNEEYLSDFTEGSDRIRYELMYLDNDEIPELLMCDGTYTHAPTWIYTMRDGEVKFLGKYSQYGRLEVLKGFSDSIICTQYGGYGFFMDVYIKLENGTLETIAAFASDGSGYYADEVLYYMDFPFPKNMHEDISGFDNSILTEEYLVPEEEFIAAQEKIMRDYDYVSKEVDYASMMELP